MGPRRLSTILFALTLARPALADAPRVVETVPRDGAADVDPATREIRVVFDRPMGQGGYSFVGGGESFPETIGRPLWVGDRTCVLPVRLRAEHEYQVGINSPKFQNFRSAAGEPAEPYPLRFRTGRAKPPAPGEAQADRRRAIEGLRRAIDQDYAYRDRLGVDWSAAFRRAEPRLLAATTPDAFAAEAARLLAPAKDLHLWLKVGDRTIPTATDPVRPNRDEETVRKLVPGYAREGTVALGRFDDGIAYIAIDSWSRETAEDLEAAFAALADAKAVIVDVRTNSGGDERLARSFVGCFLDNPRAYARHIVRESGRDLPPRDRIVTPNRARPRFRGRSAVLMGPVCMSSCESFLLMMRSTPGCTLVGERSRGSSGNPQPVPLGNGVVAFIPSWRDLQPDGTPFEGRGIEPDVLVKAGPGDPALDAALAILREP